MTLTLVDRSEVPKDAKVHRPIWRFKVKLDGRYKARLCFDGRYQVQGKDVWETTAPVPPFELIRVCLTLLLQASAKIAQADILNAFLHSEVDAMVFMEQPEGYRIGRKVCRLNKSLYGLQQASRLWHLTLIEALVEEGLVQSAYCNCILMGRWKSIWMIVIIYVDDLIVGSNDPEKVESLLDKLQERFGVRIEDFTTYLGMKCTLRNGSLFLSQQHLVRELIAKTDCQSKRPTLTPANPKTFLEEMGEPFEDLERYRSVIGSLLWLGRSTRPDILFQVIALAQFQASPTMIQWGAAQHLVRYIKGTSSLGIKLNADPADHDIKVYFDAGHHNPALRSRSSTGFLVTLGGAPIAWSSSIQKNVTISSAESEYMAISEGMRVVLWMTYFFEEMEEVTGIKRYKRPNCFTDSQPAIALIEKEDPCMPSTRHLQARAHWMWQHFRSDGNGPHFQLNYINTKENLADILTKSFIATAPFCRLRDKILSHNPDYDP